jgi:hypothetical protein
MAKKFLAENTVRRFMSLADLGSLSGDFINEAFSDEAIVEEEDLEENVEENLGAYNRDEDLGAEEELPGEELAGEELPGEELPEDDREELARKAIEAVAAALGVEVEVSGGEEDLGDELELGDEELPGEELPEEELEEGAWERTKKFASGAADVALAPAAPLKQAVGGVGKMATALVPGDDDGDDNDDLSESIMNLLAKSDIEIVDDDQIRETLVKKVAVRVVKRLLEEKD